MVPTRVKRVSAAGLNERSLASITGWLEQHKHSFYFLGWSYLRNVQLMEELFLRYILKIYKDLRTYNSDTSFESWVMPKFIHLCRELSLESSLQDQDESITNEDLFKALGLLESHEREAVVLTYLNGIPHKETAELLGVSIEKLKEYLYSGIQSFKKGLGHGQAANGCNEYHVHYIDYLERNLERPKKIEFEMHVYHCRECQADLAAFQEVMLTLSNLSEEIKNFRVPKNLMDTIKSRLSEMDQQRRHKNKKRIKRGVVFASIFALFIGFELFTGSFTKLYYSYAEDNQQLRAFLQQDLGKVLKMEAESDGVNIKIKSVIADDFQTLVFYEITDTEEDNQYMMNYQEGVYVENEFQILNTNQNIRFYPPDVESDINNNKKNVYQGKLGLPPLTEGKATIKLKITSLRKLIRDETNRGQINNIESVDFENGGWEFEIPATKQPSAEYPLNEETEIDGIKVRLEKLTLAPTATVLRYSINNENQGKRLEMLQFANLQVDNKKMKPDMYGGMFMDSHQEMNWIGFQTHFDPLFGNKPKEVSIQFESAYFNIEDNKTIPLDASKKYPQTFEYAGSTISIDRVEVGQPATVVISNRKVENRAYESLNLQINGEPENGSVEGDSKGVIVDKHGKEYNDNDPTINYEKIEQPRYFPTEQTFRLNSDNPGKDTVPKSIEIYGYSTTKYLDTIVKISLE